jgi:hypothetical protein
LAIGREQAVLAVLAGHPEDPTGVELAAQIGPRHYAQYARAVIADLGDRFGSASAACSLLWCVPNVDRFAGLGLPGAVVAVAGSEGGALRANAVDAAHARGFSHVAVIALDAPHVANDIIYTGLGQADQYGVVFGAGDRGALYLVATKERGDVFRDVRFEGADAATDVIVEAGLRGLSCAPLVGNFVVADAADLARVAAYFGRHKTVESRRTRDAVAQILAALEAEGHGGAGR